MTKTSVPETCFGGCLKAPPGEHMARVIAKGDMRRSRGRSAALEETRQLLAGRDRLYARADTVIDTSSKPLKQSLAQLANLIAKEDK